jgi:hypothetical protein
MRFRIALATALLAAVASATPAFAAPPGRHVFTADEMRWYLEGFVDGASPVGWAAITGRCIAGSRALVCLIVARNAAGQQMCYRAAVSFTGRFLMPIKGSPCGSVAVQKGPAS